MHLLDTKLLTTDDVLLEPQLGQLYSRKDALLAPFIYSAPMDKVTGLKLAKEMLAQGEYPVLSRFLPEEEYSAGITLLKNTEAFVAIGATKTELLRFITILKSINLEDTDTLNVAIDIAHGDSIVGHEAAIFLRSYSFIKHIMSGSIATAAAAQRCIQSGCTHLRIGIGCGSLCSTRLMTGIGVPQLSAVYLIRSYLDNSIYKDSNITLIADGGIRNPGDAVKLLAAGANGVMLGSVLSKVRESPGWLPVPTVGEYCGALPGLVKEYRGQASASFQQDIKGVADRCPEGVSTNISWTGLYLKDVLEMYRGGLSSALSYLGFKDIKDLHPTRVNFLEVTEATRIEGTTHGAR